MDPWPQGYVIYDPLLPAAISTLISPVEHQSQTEDESEASGATITKQSGKKRPRCGDCIGCQPIQKEDCGECPACKDKPKFGGPGRKHLPCMYHQCQKLKYKPKDLSKAPNTAAPKGRCGKCIGCLRNDKKDDCGQCKACKKKAKFGGDGKSYQLCRYRDCQKKKYTPKSGALGAEPSVSGKSVGEKKKLDSASMAQKPEVSGGSAVKRKVDGGEKTESQPCPLVSILKKSTTGKGTPVATKQQKTQPAAEESPVERAPVASVIKQPAKFSKPSPQPRPILKRKHPTTGEGAPVATKHQKIQPTAEGSPVKHSSVELKHQSSCATPGTELDSQATLPKILTFLDKSGKNIGVHKRIGAKYKTFGIILLNDSDGRTVDTISTNEKGDAEDINIEILKRWVQGAGRQPATWRTLIQVLKQSSLTTLAKEIEDKIKYTYVVD